LNKTEFNAIFYVVRAPDTKLCSAERNIFKNLPSLFAHSPAVNVIANFSDSGEAVVKRAPCFGRRRLVIKFRNYSLVRVNQRTRKK